MVDLVEDFYRRVTVAESRRLERGQICWAPVPYLSSQIQTVSLESYDPRDESRNLYSIRQSEPDEATLFNHAPVHDLRLESNEELLITKSKLRPVIATSQRNEFWQLGGGRLAERGRVCLPMYSFHPDDSDEFRERVRAQEYPWWIYMPDQFGLREGFARIDRIQTIEESHLRPSRNALTEDALWFVSEWLRYWFTEEIDPVLLEYRQELLQSIQ